MDHHLFNQASQLRFFAVTDFNLTNPLLTVPVPADGPDQRSGIFRYTLLGLP